MNITVETRFLLNMQMIVDELEDDYDIILFNRGEDKQSLISPEIYYGQSDLKSDVLYVAESSVFEKYPIRKKGIKCICIGSLNQECFMMDVPVVEICGKNQWQEIFNKVQNCFVKYISWTERLLRIMDNGGGLYEMCVSAIEFFDNPLYIHDENFNVLSMPMWVVGMNHFQVDETTGNISVPLKSLNRFKLDKEYIKTLSKKEAALWNPAGNSHRVLYVNIWAFDQTYCGRILIQELNRSLKPSDFIMAEFFGKMLTIALERNLFKTDNVTSFEEILSNMFKGNKYEDAYLEQRMKMVRWRPNNKYICFVMEPDANSMDIFSVKKICSTVNMVLKKSFSFSIENTIYTICNLTLSEMSVNDCREKLTQLNEATDIVVGASTTFNDFMMFPEYCRLAQKALEMSRSLGKNEVYSQFSDYALDYIIGHFKEEFDERIVCSNAICKLKKIDQDRNSDYFITLKTYLDNGMQQTVTATKLNVHRSTLVYRLEKIQEMVGINLDNPDERLFIQISIIMLEQHIRNL